jgi:hypothetical protein
LRLKTSFRFSIYAAFTVLFLTGAGWLVADWQKAASGDEIWQQTAAFLLMVHGGCAMVTLMLLGELIPTHLRRAWRTRKNRVSGLVVVTLNALLIVTAFGLYYLGAETVRPWMSWIHIAAGLSLSLLIPVHIFLGRADRDSAASVAKLTTDDPPPRKVLFAPTARSARIGTLSDPIRAERAVDSVLAHVLVGEPDPISPGHALGKLTGITSSTVVEADLHPDVKHPR